MSDPKELEGAIGGYEEGEEVSADEKKLLEMLRMLGIKPKIDSPEDVAKIINVFAPSKKEPDKEEYKPHTRLGTYHFPKLSSFYGEEGKGEVQWNTFRYEIESIISDEFFSKEQILLGIRRALKGNASDKVRRMGTHATLREVIVKLGNDYGTVESKESVMRKFYSSQQRYNETVEQFSSRLEELFDQAVQLNALKRHDTYILKDILYAGLNKELRHLSIYHQEKIKEYDEFKRVLRKMEAELKEDSSSTEKEKKPCKPVMKAEPEKNELSEMKALLLQLNERMMRMEKDKESKKDFEGQDSGYSYGYRGRGFSRGYGENRGTFRGRGRGDFKLQRPTSTGTFKPKGCYHCGENGHIISFCPYKNSNCFKCNRPGHKARDCPNL